MCLVAHSPSALQCHCWLNVLSASSEATKELKAPLTALRNRLACYGPSPQGCSQAILCPAWICAWDCPPPGAFGFVDLYEVHMGPPFQTVQVPLNGIPFLQCANCAAQLGVIGKIAEGALSSTVHVTNRDVKWYPSQY